MGDVYCEESGGRNLLEGIQLGEVYWDESRWEKFTGMNPGGRSLLGGIPVGEVYWEESRWERFTGRNPGWEYKGHHIIQ